MATQKKPKTDKPAAKTDTRERPPGKFVRLTAEEEADLDEVIERWEKEGKELGYGGKGFAGWLRAIIDREKKKGKKK